jgi:plastocyanin
VFNRGIKNFHVMLKTLLSLFSVTLITSFFAVTEAFAVKHVVNVQNFSFVPANLNVQVGDTIRWVWINGTHTTTSTTIPFGAPAWDEPITSSNTFYEYRVNVVGVYSYLCTPHSSSQIGQFIASAPTPTLAVTPSNQNVPSTSGNTNFTVTSNSNWTASSNAGWCTVTSSGSGNSTLVAIYQANTTTSQRVATITVTVSGLPSTFVTVTQAGAVAILAVTPTNQNVSAPAGTTNFTVTSNSDWTASSNAGWCSVTPSGSGNGFVVAAYQQNTNTSIRVATITVAVSGGPSTTVTVTQAADAAALSVSPANHSVAPEAGSVNFSVISNTSWTAVSNNDWCVVTPNGTGNGSITATYDENTTSAVRMAVITVVAGGTATSEVTVTQFGTGTILIVDPLNQDVNALTGMTTFNITSNSNWTVTSDASWAVPTSEGSGNGILVVNYDENTSTDGRIAVLTVGAPDVIQMITITQEGSVSAVNNELPQLKIFPNPAKDFVNITSDLKPVNSNVRVVDLKGNILYEQATENPSLLRINTTTFAPGSYIVMVSQEGNSFTGRFVITE